MSEPRPPIALVHYQQSAPGYCLPACARMVLAQLGIQLSEREVGRQLGAGIYGTPSYALERLTGLGPQVTLREWSLSQLLSALQASHPVIVFVRTRFLDHWDEDVAHAIVVTGAEPDQQFWVHDPAWPTGPLAVSWNGLLAAWAEFSYPAAVITR